MDFSFALCSHAVKSEQIKPQLSVMPNYHRLSKLRGVAEEDEVTTNECCVSPEGEEGRLV